MRRPRIAGSPRQRQRARELTDSLEWERRKGVITALIRYSGERGVGWSNLPPPRRPWTPLQVSIPRPREPLPSEERLVEQARRSHFPHLRNDINKNRGR
jgi:hypothetical protein